MYRCLLALLIALACSALWAAPPTEAEIQQAVKDLADKRFTVREKASKTLWQAGSAAEPALKEAQHSKDPETARRARAILDKFEFGIFPDTPKELAALIDEYRSADKEGRKAAVGKIMALGKVGFGTIRRLADKESPADKPAIFAQITHDAPRGVARSLVEGDLAFTEELLDMCLSSDTDEAATNYAAFHYLRGSLDAAIKRWQAEWQAGKPNPLRPRAGDVLVHLYRAKGDFAAARKIAGQMSGDSLLEQLLWEQGDWKALAAKQNAESREPLSLGVSAAVARLAGDKDRFQKLLADAGKLAESGDRFDVRVVAEALLLNGKAAQAIDMLTDRKKNAAMTFDLLCTQQRYKEAFSFAGEVRSSLQGDEAFALELRRGRMWYVLGDKDLALQTLNRLAEGLREPGQTTSARDYIKVLVRLGLKSQAADFCGTYLAGLQKQGATSGWAELLEPLFDPNAEAAEVWWNFLRKKLPDENPAALMQKVVQLFDGKAVEGRDAWAAELAVAPPITAEYPATFQAAAAADVLQLGGQTAKARELLEKSAKAKPSYAVCLRLADMLMEAKQFKEAAAQYELAAKADPSQVVVVFLQGDALTKAGDAKEGKRLTEISHWLPLGSEYVRGKFADELEKRGFADAARRERDLVMTVGWYRQWHVGNVLNHAARQAVRRKDYDAAVALFDKSVAGCLRMGASYADHSAYLLVPQTVAHYRIHGLLARGKFDEALSEIRASLEVVPGSLELLTAVVPQLDRAGRRKDADALFTPNAALYETLSQTFPRSAHFHNSFAWLAANCRRDLDQALTHAQTAVKLEPKAAGFLDTLAEVHFRRGEQAKAQELMKQCLAMEPKSVYFRKQLARFAAGDVASDPPDSEDD